SAVPYHVYSQRLNFSSSRCVHRRGLHALSTRRSSDLDSIASANDKIRGGSGASPGVTTRNGVFRTPIRNPLQKHEKNGRERRSLDRKSTRLNSSHVKISYAVFCLKKKKYKRER